MSVYRYTRIKIYIYIIENKIRITYKTQKKLNPVVYNIHKSF